MNGRDSALYMEGIRDGNPEQAMTKYTGARYTQHSTGVPTNQDGFISFFKPFLERNPIRDIRVLRSIEDGPYVFCHVFQSLNDGAAEWITMDMFDTDAEGRIIEHWDVICAPQATPSGNSMTESPNDDDATDPGATEANKAIVKEFTKRVLIEGGHDELADFIAPDITERSPRVGAGLEGWQAALSAGALGRYEMLFKLIGEGDLVVTYCRVHKEGADHAVFDLYRLRDGRIAEHWDASEEIGPRDTWNNSGKF